MFFQLYIKIGPSKHRHTHMALSEIVDVVVMQNKYIMSLSKKLQDSKQCNFFMVYGVNKSYI